MIRARASVAILAIAMLPSSVHAADVDKCVKAAERGQLLRRESKLVEARDELIACAREGCPGPIRSDCAKWLDDVDARTPTVSVRVQDEAGRDLQAAVTIDGAVAKEHVVSMRSNAGRHTVRAEAKEHEAAEQTVTLVEGEKARMVTLVLSKSKPAELPSRAPPIELPREDGPRKPPPIVYPLLGVSVVALGSFAFFGITGRSDAEDLRTGCGQTSSCMQEDVDAARTKYLVADISLGVGIVALGAAAVLWLTSR